jgi:hypothetical protein
MLDEGAKESPAATGRISPVAQRALKNSGLLN